MEDMTAILVVALLGGMAAAVVRLPPLMGFLVAGFVLNVAGVESVPALDVVAELGVTLLLFGVGLKIDLRQLAERQVWATATVHMLGSTLLGAGVVALVALAGVALLEGSDWRTWVLVGFALSFSSTVFVVKTLEERSGSRSLGGRTAIGVLIVQDLAAVAYLAASAGEPPSPYAVLVLLLLPGAWVLRTVLARLGHDELRPLFGLVLALVPGYALFDAVGLKGDLGALVVGMLLAGRPGADSLSKSLFTLKDLLLVGFFVSIGIGALPSAEHLLVALLLVLVLLPLKAIGFALLLALTGLRRRTAVLAGSSLANFSEFGLIVAVASSAEVLGEEWVVTLATAIAASFVVGTAVGRRPEYLVGLLSHLVPERPEHRLHPEDRPLDVGHAEAVVLGMGRVGRSAYERLEHLHGLGVVGVESSGERVARLVEEGVDVVEGDATDPEFYERLRTGDVRMVLLAMPFHGNNLDALQLLRSSGFGGTVAIVTQYDADLRQARALGASTGFQLYDGAGTELADRAAQAAGLRIDDD